MSDLDVKETGVLLVDNAPEYNLPIARRFRSLHPTSVVRSAESIAEAKTLLGQEPFDVMIIDRDRRAKGGQSARA